MAEYLYRTLEAYLKHYEKEKERAQVDPYEEMLDLLSAPYNDLRNYDEFLAGLKEVLTPEEAEVWRFYPDYTIRVDAKSPREICGALRPELQPRVEELSRSLAEKKFLQRKETPAGEPGYIRTYFFHMIIGRYHHPDDTLLTKAAEHWWYDIVERGDSAMLRGGQEEMRVLPHEGALTGDSRHGKIPMHLEIPDTRQVIADIDSAEEILKKCRRFAVTDCICRLLKDRDHSRTCNYPIKDVCITLDQVADDAIAMGSAREVSREEALQIIRRCRDLGMVQIVSNAQHPLDICNCCKCCCAGMRQAQRYEDGVVSSRYVADAAHPEACILCGKCAKLCPMDAVVIAKDGGTYVKAQQCIGCGVCVSQCPKAVLKLVKRPGAVDHIERETLDRVYM